MKTKFYNPMRIDAIRMTNSHLSKNSRTNLIFVLKMVAIHSIFWQSNKLIVDKQCQIYNDHSIEQMMKTNQTAHKRKKIDWVNRFKKKKDLPVGSPFNDFVIISFC